MSNIFKGFLSSFFSLIICIALIVNFWIWSGYNPMGFANLDNTYFGFNSLLNAFRYYQDWLGVGYSGVSEDLFSSLTFLGNAINLGIPRLIQTIEAYNGGLMNQFEYILNIGLFLVTFLFTPLVILIAFVVIILQVAVLLIGIGVTFLMATSGYFNVPVPTTDFPEISEIVNTLCIC